MYKKDKSLKKKRKKNKKDSENVKNNLKIFKKGANMIQEKRSSSLNEMLLTLNQVMSQ
jgi:Pyruvate/2-oxoacid:ferredoxin oxidoreductase gamma subunit